MKPRGSRQLLGHGVTMLGEPEQAHWLPIDQLDSCLIYPTFFKTMLNPLPSEVRHIITRE